MFRTSSQQPSSDEIGLPGLPLTVAGNPYKFLTVQVSSCKRK
jgi:hypothetical protein